MEFYCANLDEIFKYLSDAVSLCIQNVSGNNAPVCRLRSMAARARARQCLHPSRRVREREPVVADVLLLLYICVSQTYVSTGKAASSTVS